MVLLFGAGLMFRTIARIARTELGFRTEGVVTASMLLPQARYPDSAAKREVMDRVLARLDETEGVQSAAAVFPLPFWPPWRYPVIAEGTAVEPESAPRAGVYTVSPDYFETVDVPLHVGRTFRASDDHAAPLVAVVSGTLARRLAADGTVIGRRIRVRVPNLTSFDEPDEQPWRTVVGVVGDTKKSFAPSEMSEVPDVYVPVAQNARGRQSIVVRTERAERLLYEPVRQAVASVDPLLALQDVGSLKDLVAAEGAQRRILTVLLTVFAIFSLGLSALALYASLSYTVVQRRAELAVRMAIGASTRSILRLVIAEGIATTAVGVASGIVVSLALGRVLQNQLYGVSAGDPTTLVLISVVLAVAALAACIVPGLRATRTDPALALRE
jgi:predicted permease